MITIDHNFTEKNSQKIFEICKEKKIDLLLGADMKGIDYQGPL